MPKRKSLDLKALQVAATQYAREAASTTNFGIGGLSEEEYGPALQAIMQAIVSAWVAGFAIGRDS